MNCMNVMDVYHMFREAWNLYRNFAGKNLSENEADEFIQKSSQVYEKYRTPFAKAVILAVTDEIDRGMKRRGGK